MAAATSHGAGTMDTSALTVSSDGTPYPHVARDAVRHGVRVALELLRADVVPARVVLSSAPINTPAWPAAPEASMAWRDAPGPTVCTHTDCEIVVSYPAVVSPEYLGDPPLPHDLIVRALAFCSGYATARFIASHAEIRGGADWLPPRELVPLAAARGAEREETLTRVGGYVATIASGFTMVTRHLSPDPQSESVAFFLERLHALIAAEGSAAPWRGAVGKATQALMREVRFGPQPGKVTAMGVAAATPAHFHALLRYADGAGPWPFAGTSPRDLGDSSRSH